MAANKFRDVDTSAIWKPMVRAWLPTFTPIQIKLGCKVRNDPLLIDPGSAKRWNRRGNLTMPTLPFT